MKAAALGLVCAVALQASFAQEVASCRDPKGPSYFHHAGGTAKAGAGWTTDKISGGRISLIQTRDQVDLLFTDIRLKPMSATADGAKVILLRSTGEAATVLVMYSHSTEVYTFFSEKDGSAKFTMFQTKTGDLMPVPKSSLMLGDCEPMSLSLLK
ncbi:MAG: hypothetical protein EON54_03565 [Alcaligenaceae bacterium]|nr:MAG: hypothetical protein EON54_03565 [Alcaligenaceae bacterium]